MTRDPSNPFDKLNDLRASLPPGPAPVAPTRAERAAAKAVAQAAEKQRVFLEKVVVRFTRKGHGGKTVTVVQGIAPAALEALCTEMKKALGVGARVEDGLVVLQGDLVDRTIAFLEKRGAPKIVRGS